MHALTEAVGIQPHTITHVTTAGQLFALRRATGRTQRALADLLGVSESTVVRLESGKLTLDQRWASHLTLLFAHLLKGQDNGA